MSTASVSRTKVRRVPSRAVYDREAIDAILDEGMIAHLGFVHDGQPFVIPTLHARVGDTVYFHGSAASRAVRTLSSGVPACLTITLLDGVVLARSAFHTSLNYRSVVVLGTATPIEGTSERILALEAFMERLIPGRWGEVRPPSAKELKGTSILALALTETSAKVRTGPPEDDRDDFSLPVWAGVIPIHTSAGPPTADARTPRHINPSPAITTWTPQRHTHNQEDDMSITTTSRTRRTLHQIRTIWNELDRVQRRLFEIQTGVTLGKPTSRPRGRLA